MAKKSKFHTGTIIGNIILLLIVGAILFGLGTMAYFLIRALIFRR